MNYAYYTAGELVNLGKADPRFNKDALFTALVARLEFISENGKLVSLPAPHYNQVESADVRR